MDHIIGRLRELTISNLSVSPAPLATIETVEQAFSHLTLDATRPQTPTTSDNSSYPDSDLKRLCLLDERLNSHMESILLCLDELASPDLASQHRVEVDLVQEKGRLVDSMRQLHGLASHSDAEIRTLVEAMRDRMSQFASAIDMYIEILYERSPPRSSPHVVNTGNINL
jgi:hypothetical protein